MTIKNASLLGRTPFCPNKKLCFPIFAILLWFQASSQIGGRFTVKVSNAALSEVFNQIEQQSSYRVFYLQGLIEKAKPVSIDLKNASLKQILDEALREQTLIYTIDHTSILIKTKVIGGNRPVTDSLIQLSGRVISEENGEPLMGATVHGLGNNVTSITDKEGEFSMSIPKGSEIEITYVGYLETAIRSFRSERIIIRLTPLKSALDEVVVMGYGSTSKRLNTGNITKITNEEIRNQPVTNPLAALIGRVPGLLITQSSGMGSSAFSVQLRGKNSITQGTDPFFIIDGVPYAPGNSSLNQIANATGPKGMSPLALINTNDIESIEVLKDADATAIYGSRGANGVILITTKSGKSGKTRNTTRISYGLSKAGNVIKMLNTTEYLQMRREAFANSGVVPDEINAPDLFLLDTTRYTDYRKLLTGGTAKNFDVQSSLSGGNETTQFLVSGSYHRETTILPTDLANSRASVLVNLSHQSKDKRFRLKLNANFTSANEQLPITDLTGFINLMPHYRLYEDDGKLAWSDKGTTYLSLGLYDFNPIAFMLRKYDGDFKNLNSSINLSYTVTKGLTISSNFGYNLVLGNENVQIPSTTIDPNGGVLPSAYFANRTQQSWIIEPQLNYLKRIGKSQFDVMIGGSIQNNEAKGISVSGENYSSDALLGSIAGAGIVRSTNSLTEYKYRASFGRINYNYDKRYLLNLSARRDGTSRFGPSNQYANFGAIGAAWIFSSERFFPAVDFPISFGKIRLSYGRTGNDQIGDYKFLDTWTGSSNTYLGQSSVNPTALFNPEYAWEVNKKLEFGIELGFLNDRLLLTASYFRNISDNQLVSYALPSQTGFNSIGRNIDARVQNLGLEFSLTSQNISGTEFSWNTSFVITATRNKLLRFPGLAQSSYSNTYLIDHSLSTLRLYNYQGLDPATGLYQFEDIDGNGILNVQDNVALVNTDPKFYGGITNTFNYGKIGLSFFIEFRRQLGANYFSPQGFQNAPGYFYNNQSRLVLDRWQKPGDQASVQKYSAIYDATLINASNILTSSGAYSDASFIRFKTISISYEIPGRKTGQPTVRCFLNAQNLFTITRYKGSDPEVQYLYSLPPLRTIVGGLEINF